MTTPNPLLIDIPMPIVTPRLILRAPQAGDGAAIHDAKNETWAHLNLWMPWAKTPSTPEEDEAVARDLSIQFQKRDDLTMFGFARDDGRFIIGCGLHRFDWHKRRIEIGYWVRAREHGKGFAPEAANALTRFAFAALQARVVVIEHADGNDRSRRVIEKLGFDKEGVARGDIHLPNDDIVDRHVYSRVDMNGLPDLDVRWGGVP